MQQYLRDLVMSLLNRLRTSRTDKFVVGLVHWICYVSSLETGGYTPDTIANVVNGIQPQLVQTHPPRQALTFSFRLWGSVLKDVMLPVLPKVPVQDKRLVLVGLTRILFRGQATVSLANNEPWYVALQDTQEVTHNSRPLAFTALLQLFGSQASAVKPDEDPDAGITSIDYEEQTAGYQVAYSKLAASETARPDPVGYAGDAKRYLLDELARAVQRTGGNVWTGLIQRSNSPAKDVFLQEYASAGHGF